MGVGEGGEGWVMGGGGGGDETGLGVQIKLLEGMEQKERDWRRGG